MSVVNRQVFDMTLNNELNNITTKQCSPAVLRYSALRRYKYTLHDSGGDHTSPSTEKKNSEIFLFCQQYHGRELQCNLAALAPWVGMKNEAKARQRFLEELG